jgi:hypothetical protein
MTRRLVCAMAIAAIWIVLLGWAAGLRWNTPLRPAARMVLPARDFHVVMGAGVEDGDELRVGAVGDDGNALQAMRIAALHAGDFPILRYRFDDFPRTLELSLIFRRADAPDDVQAVTVPWPGDGWRTVDLRGVAEWRGDIVELGFVEYATAQLVPPSVAFRPFRFDRAELLSPSWRGGIDALHTAWFAYTPWALLSVSALAPDRATLGTSSPLPLLPVGLALSLLAAAVILRWSRARLFRRLVLAIVVLWVLLDWRWLQDFRDRHALTESLYAGKSWDERQRLLPEQDIALAAEQVRNWLATQPPTRHILLDADSKYAYLRMLYLLLPQNIGLLSLSGSARLPPDSLIVLYASTQWVYDAEHHLLNGTGRSYGVDPVYEGGGARVYRLRGVRR